MTATNASKDLVNVQRVEAPGYEDVRAFHDPSTGLRSIIAVHTTRLGPALGGTRFYPYADEASALEDVKRLSAGMTYKAAAAGLALGGGKAVIIGDPAVLKTPEILGAYGRFVNSFGGRYITAADVGTTSEDMDVISATTTHVVGRTLGAGGLGDSSLSTAQGVLVSMRAAVEFTQRRSLRGLRIGVEGAGKVGSELIPLLQREGATVCVSESHAPAQARLRALHPDIPLVDTVLTEDIDVYAPCGLGATLTADTAETLGASVVCGAANNQLSAEHIEDRLRTRQILWVPDYVANAGGLIQVAAELEGRVIHDVRPQIEQLGRAVVDILSRAEADRVPPGAAARQIATERLAAVH